MSNKPLDNWKKYIKENAWTSTKTSPWLNPGKESPWKDSKSVNFSKITAKAIKKMKSERDIEVMSAGEAMEEFKSIFAAMAGSEPLSDEIETALEALGFSEEEDFAPESPEEAIPSVADRNPSLREAVRRIVKSKLTERGE